MAPMAQQSLMATKLSRLPPVITRGNFFPGGDGAFSPCASGNLTLGGTPPSARTQRTPDAAAKPSTSHCSGDSFKLAPKLEHVDASLTHQFDGNETIEQIWAERFAATQSFNSPTVVQTTHSGINEPMISLHTLVDSIAPFLKNISPGRHGFQKDDVPGHVAVPPATTDAKTYKPSRLGAFTAAVVKNEADTVIPKATVNARSNPIRSCRQPPKKRKAASALITTASIAAARAAIKPEITLSGLGSDDEESLATRILDDAKPVKAKKMVKTSSASAPKGKSKVKSKGNIQEQKDDAVATTTAASNAKKEAAIVHRRARNRVNAGISRQKREIYIQYLEEKAPTTEATKKATKK